MKNYCKPTIKCTKVVAQDLIATSDPDPGFEDGFTNWMESPERDTYNYDE